MNTESNLKLHHFEPRTVVAPESTPEMLRELAVPSLESFRGLAEPLAVPPSYSIRSGMTPVKNQSTGGFCTSFCTLSNLEFVQGKLDLSESCLTHEAESRWGDCKEGLATVHAYNACKSVGIVPEADWPYSPVKVCWNPPPNMSGKPRYKFSTFANVYNRPGAKVVENMIGVAQGRVVNFTAMPPQFVRLLKEALVTWAVPPSIDVPVWWASDGHFSAGWESGPDIHMPTKPLIETWLGHQGISPDEKDAAKMSPPNVSGWHCISICGYDDTQGRFTFKNSWGPWWGDSGYGTLPYDYVTAYSRSCFVGK